MDRHQWANTEAEWEKDKEQILGSLLGGREVLELPAEAEVKMMCCESQRTD